MLNPASTQSDIERGFLLRHEFTHVALGKADDRSPTWLTEGAAEYVAGSTYLASTRGAQALWDLMAAFRSSRAATDSDIDAVLRRELGVDAAGLTADALAWVNG